MQTEKNTQEIMTHEQAMPGPVAVVADNPSSIMGIVAQLAMHPGADIDKIERLMQLHTKEIERQDAKEAAAKAAEAERLFYVDFVAMKPELPLIARTKDNTHTKSKYAPLEDINKEIDPVLERHGFATTSRVIEQTDATVTMEMAVVHRAGHKLTMTLTMPIDDKGPGGTKNKTTGQGIASTMTSTKRIGFCALLNISTGDDKDMNADNGDVLSHEQAAELDQLRHAVGAGPTFLAMFGVDDIRKIKASDYETAKRTLNMKKGAKKNDAATA